MSVSIAFTNMEGTEIHITTETVAEARSELAAAGYGGVLPTPREDLKTSRSVKVVRRVGGAR